MAALQHGARYANIARVMSAMIVSKAHTKPR